MKKAFLCNIILKFLSANIAQLVEHFHGKEEVIGSIPIVGSSFVEKDTEDPKAWDALRASHQKVGLLSRQSILRGASDPLSLKLQWDTVGLGQASISGEIAHDPASV